MKRDKLRLFRHREGFDDETAYMAITPKGAVVGVSLSGEATPMRAYSKKSIEQLVKDRVWVEIDPA